MANKQTRPAFEGELPALVLEEVRGKMTEYGDPLTYTLYLSMHYRANNLLWTLHKQAKSFDTVGNKEVAVVRANRSLQRAYVWGGALALRIMDGYSSDMWQQLAACTIPEPEVSATTEFEQNQLLAESYVAFAEEGYDKSGDYGPFLDRYLSQIDPDFTNQQFLRRGLGMVMNVASQLIELQATRATTQAELELELHAADWDAAFARELQPGTD